MHEKRRTIVERMGQGLRRFDPLEAILGERECLQDRRPDTERVDSRTDVVEVSGEGERGRARSAAE